VIANSWSAWFTKVLSTTLLLLLAYAFVHRTVADDQALFADQATMIGLAFASATIMVFIVFLAQLLFIVPHQLWKEEKDRADALLGTEAGRTVADCTSNGIVDLDRLRTEMDRITDPDREYHEAWAEAEAKDREERLYQEELAKERARSRAKEKADQEARQRRGRGVIGARLGEIFEELDEEARLDRKAQRASDRRKRYGPTEDIG
jgi:hypothetical protein